MTTAATLELCGEILLLHPERAVIWPGRSTLIVADTHFGKSSVFGRHGMAVPAGSDEADRHRLTRLCAVFGITRLLILGDFLHEPLSPHSQEAGELDAWIDSLRGVRVQVIAGNHDRGVSSGWRGAIEWIEGEAIDPPFLFVHDSSKISAAHRSYFALSGHVHPVVALRGLRKKSARVPAFWQRTGGLILPSFGLFTGGYRIEPAAGERIFAVSPDQVVPFPAVPLSGWRARR
jgi:uncharacterized protein